MIGEYTRDAWVLATWTALLHGGGDAVLVPEIAEACDVLVAANGGGPTRTAGERLVAQVQALLGRSGGMIGACSALLGSRAGATLAGPTREDCTQRMRAYGFHTGSPWLAQLWERDEAGTVAPRWHVVLRVDSHAQLLDPNPYDAVDENRELPLAEFLVLWELSGSAHVHVIREAEC